jgi:WD40 repeat protein
MSYSQQVSVDSDEANFYDPGRMESNDENGDHMLELFHDQGASEISAFKLRKSSDAENSDGQNVAGGNSKYTQLKNYIGLSGPSKNGHLTDDQGSNKGSLISSLSSFSHDNLSPRNDDQNGEERSRSRSSMSSTDASDEEEEEDPDGGDDAEPAPSPNPMHQPIQYSIEDKELMKLVFAQLFGMSSGNGAAAGGNASSNQPAAQDNPYYRDRVRVTSTLPLNSSKFKDKTRLVQTIKFHHGAIWCMKFSPCGKFLCTAGQDLIVVVWCVGSLPDDAMQPTAGEKAYNRNSAGNGNGSSNNNNNSSSSSGAANTSSSGTTTQNVAGNRNSFGRRTGSTVEVAESKSVLHPTPYRTFEGHTGDIIDIAWSKSKFILSASTDKTVCLWHVSRNDCLQYFRHPDIVTAVEFHPAHDRYYISGCFDRKLRVWDIIPDGIVQEWTQTTDTVRLLQNCVVFFFTVGMHRCFKLIAILFMCVCVFSWVFLCPDYINLLQP